MRSSVLLAVLGKASQDLHGATAVLSGVDQCRSWWVSAVLGGLVQFWLGVLQFFVRLYGSQVGHCNARQQ